MAKIDKSKWTSGEKAAFTRKWGKAQRKAFKTAKNAKTFAKYKLSQKGYRYLSFDTKTGHEWKGVVDLVGVKRDKRDPDRLRVVLVQAKGGGAKVTPDELKRLEQAVKHIEIDWNVAEKPGKVVRFQKAID